MVASKDNVIRGKFRLGENAFKSSREKTNQIREEIEKINKRTTSRRSGIKGRKG